LYSVENQLVKALPKMAKAATSEDLQAGFEERLEQTKAHVQRLETIFQQLAFPSIYEAMAGAIFPKRYAKPRPLEFALDYSRSTYSALARFRMGISGSAPLHNLRKLRYSALALPRSPVSE
jgi:hypothetical protein